MFANIGSTELIVLILVAVVFLGGSKMSELGKNAGEASREFKKVKRDLEKAKDELSHELNKEPDSEKPNKVQEETK